MSKKSEYLRALVSERLTAAAEEIFALFESTIAEYEEELCRSKEENQRKQQLLDAQLQKQHEKRGVQPQTQSPCLDEKLPDSPQTREKLAAFRLENDHNELPDYPQVVKCEIDQLLSESDENDADLEACSSSASRLETEAGSELYNREFAEDSDRNLNSGFEFEGFCGNDAPAEASFTSGNAEPSKEKLKKHACYFCEKKFKDRHSLRRHTVVHTGEKPFQCQVCAKSYSYKETLMSHMALHGWSRKPGEDEAPRDDGGRTRSAAFTCPICLKSVTTSFALRSHLLIHTGEKPYSCPVCGKSFSQKVYVRKHMRTHTGEKPFSCSECDMRFSRKSNLNRHLKVHAAAQKAE